MVDPKELREAIELWGGISNDAKFELMVKAARALLATLQREVPEYAVVCEEIATEELSFFTDNLGSRFTKEYADQIAHRKWTGWTYRVVHLPATPSWKGRVSHRIRAFGPLAPIASLIEGHDQ